MLKEIVWIDPILLALAVSNSEFNKLWAFLYSSRNDEFNNGRYSYLGLIPDEEIISDDFTELEEKLSANVFNNDSYANFWIGYLGYGLKNKLEVLPEDQEAYVNFPDLWFIRYKILFIFDHQEKSLKAWCKDSAHLKIIEELITSISAYEKSKEAEFGLEIEANSLLSNMNDQEYLAYVKTILEHISCGDVYEANLTRKFYGTLKCNDYFRLFVKLVTESPGQYSCYLKFNDKHILSSSPEKFLSIDDSGNAVAQPIKGTIKITSPDGKKELEELKNSEKDKAENLMIVDLMRNDFAIGSEVGSVEVPHLFKITSYPHLHHMSSVITAKKLQHISPLQFVKNCFPPGSMTGAPKIKAMEICSQLEKQKRGVYSGAIGYFASNMSCNLSVVIRTIFVDGDKFEFQAGGAIVADSIPEAELEEIHTKTEKIRKVLGVNI